MEPKKKPESLGEAIMGSFSGFLKDIKKNLYVESTYVINKENEFLKQRRDKLFEESHTGELSDKFGIAFSGGGIRSSSICLGVVKTLSERGVLQRADYISSVSGGGYTNAYVQASLHNHELNGDKKEDFVENAYQKLVGKDFIAHMGKEGANYMASHSSKVIPSTVFTLLNVLGTIVIGLLNPIILIASIVLIWFMATQFLMGVFPFIVVDYSTNINIGLGVSAIGCWTIGMIGYYFFKATLKSFQRFNNIALIIAGLLIISIGITYFGEWNRYLETILPSNKWHVFYLLCGIVILGFFTNINSISFGRIYSDSLTRAFGLNKSIRLDKMSINEGPLNNYFAPYPLFNCCLNLAPQPGAPNLTADYFLLSPKFMGSKRTGYTATYPLSLSSAMATSAAAINTGMGVFSSSIASVVIGLLNLRMGKLLYNPNKFKNVIELLDTLDDPGSRLTKGKNIFRILILMGKSMLTWWPRHYIRSLLSTNSVEDTLLDVSDGGHIENLAVVELLKRKCNIIIGFDGGMDADYELEDLKNLIKRAKNELGIEIKFDDKALKDIQPNEYGFSNKRFAVATIKYPDNEVKDGTYVYVKSSVKGNEEGKPFETPLEKKVRGYIKYNSEFPHHTTSDQSFEPIQFHAYFNLGQSLCRDLIGEYKWEDSGNKNSITTRTGIINKIKERA